MAPTLITSLAVLSRCWPEGDRVEELRASRPQVALWGRVSSAWPGTACNTRTAHRRPFRGAPAQGRLRRPHQCSTNHSTGPCPGTDPCSLPVLHAHHPFLPHGCVPPRCWALVPSGCLCALLSPGHLVGAPRWCSDPPSEDAWMGAMSGDTLSDADGRLRTTPHPHPFGRSASPLTLPGRIESSAWPTDRVVAWLASRAPLPAASLAGGCDGECRRPGAGGVWGPQRTGVGVASCEAGPMSHQNG